MYFSWKKKENKTKEQKLFGAWIKEMGNEMGTEEDTMFPATNLIWMLRNDFTLPHI